MPLQKQNIDIPFVKGLDRKTDPKRIPIGKFYRLVNSVFTVAGQLTKRNGFGPLATLPDTTTSYLTSFQGNLTAIGKNLQALSRATNTWVQKGSVVPLNLSTLALIRNNANQNQADSQVAANGLVCTVYTENNGAQTSYKYVVSDVTTGQNIIPPTTISDAFTGYGTPKVFLVGNFFVIVFTNKVAATYHLKYIAVSTVNPTANTTSVDISTVYSPSTTIAFDAALAGENLYIAWYGGTNTIFLTSLTSTLSIATAASFSGTATLMSVCVDNYLPATPIIYVSFYDLGSTTGKTLAVDQNLNQILAPTQMITVDTALNLTSAAYNQTVTLFWEVQNAYGYDSGIASNYIKTRTLTQGGSASSATTLVRSVGLASKAFIVNGNSYFLCVYSSTYQPTYFLMNSSGNVIAKISYQNGAGYLTTGLPAVTVSGTKAYISYLFKDLIQAVNKNTNVPAGTQTAGIYSQTGINLATFDFNSSIVTSEIGNDLHLTGGFLWMYDGYAPVEHNFFLYPDSVEASWSASGGSIVAKPDSTTNTNAYWYQAVYEWTDNQGNAFRSAPSIPIPVTTSGSGTSGSITVHVPTLRLTYKTANPVKIVLYRWSVAQQAYYQVTSITQPTLNSTTTDAVTITDTSADATILGNNLLYTTGGIVEDVGAPSFNAMTLFNSRLFGIDAEDPDLLWFSKQVVENTPVEMSDLFTYYVPPTIAAQGSTGPMKCVGAMDDKLVIYKSNAIYYLVGQGPDNTGANSDYPLSPTFITSTVGCTNQNSIVLTPRGLMFQSDKGIWLLARDLSTPYVGSPVEDLVIGNTVLSAACIPETTQVRFQLSSGIVLMYDYYYDEWGWFLGIPGIASTLYQNLHTFCNSRGMVFQETPGEYLDGSNPVLMGFTTGWINPQGLQGYQRAYFFSLLGTYLSPHKLSVSVAYDYNPSPTQSVLIAPDNYSPYYGGDLTYGAGISYGGPDNGEQWKIDLQRQTCQAFQISVQEVFDPILGMAAGAGLTLSGINCVIGLKKPYSPIRASRTTG